MSSMPSEPMRNLGGASMLMGHAALPFKDIIRNFDRFTQSVIQSLVSFNRMLNKDVVKVADYDVIARGATSLIAKELRGQQIDQLVSTLTPEEKIHADMRKLVEARFRGARPHRHAGQRGRGAASTGGAGSGRLRRAGSADPDGRGGDQERPGPGLQEHGPGSEEPSYRERRGRQHGARRSRARRQGQPDPCPDDQDPCRDRSSAGRYAAGRW